MTSSYKFHDGVGEIVPFYARYQYPTQANKAWKTTVKIPPANGTTFQGTQYGASININLPAQGYMHTQNSYLTFDVVLDLVPGSTVASYNTRFQNHIASIFDRMRISYGSLQVEDLRKVNVIVRMVTEGVGQNTNGTIDQRSILEGIGGTMFAQPFTSDQLAMKQVPGVASSSSSAPPPTRDAGPVPPSLPRLVNTRLHAIQNYGYAPLDVRGTAISLPSPNGKIARRYTVQLPFGLFQQNKLLPLKWMASQLTISLDLAPPTECIVTDLDLYANTCGYEIQNMFFNAELMEFDSSYDAAFLEGLRGGGVPIKFASWNTYVNTPAASTSQTILIPERNRSLKALFTVQCPPAAACWDSHAMVQSSANTQPLVANANAGGAPTHYTYASGHLKDYQYRIGGKYWPNTPVQCGRGDRSNGASEAYMEFAKAMNLVGDYRLFSSVNPQRWSQVRTEATGIANDVSVINDWSGSDRGLNSDNMDMLAAGPSFFVVAANLEASTGGEISGLNGEEQNDIALNMTYSLPQDPKYTYYTFVYYDALLVLRENNLVELIK